MDLLNSPKHIRALGRQLKKERGDTLFFARSQSNLLIAIQAYARVLGISLNDMKDLNNSLEDNIFIPEFLRKK